MLQCVITDIYNDLLPFPLAHSIFPLHSANASADHNVFPLGMIQIFIHVVSGPLVVLSKLNCHSFPLTFFTRHGSTKSCPPRNDINYKYNLHYLPYK